MFVRDHQDAADDAVHGVLIVDDHPVVRLGFRVLIDDEPDLLVAGEAATSREALVLARKTKPDVVILDLALPDSRGLELLKRLLSLAAPPQILVCSMHEESLFAMRAIGAGARGYINKQHATDHVIDAIRQVLAGKIYIGPRLTDELPPGAQSTRVSTGAGDPLQVLSDRELEVFRLIGECLNASQIGDQLHISVKTVETHRRHIKAKLQLTSSELLRYAVQWLLEQA